MAKISDSLKDSIKGAVSGKIESKKAAPEKEESLSFLNISAKNFLSIAGFARDLNVASQNVKQLVGLMGGKPRDKEDMHFLKDDERTRKLKVEAEKLKPTPVGEDEKAKKADSMFSKLGEKIKKTKTFRKARAGFKRSAVGRKVSKMAGFMKAFSLENIIKSLTKYLVIASIITVIFTSFKDTFVEWATSLWDAIKESFDGFVEKIKEWFNEIVQPIIDKVMEFVQPIIDAISNVLKKIGDFFTSYFEFWKDLIMSPIETVKKVWEKFTSILDFYKKAWRSVIEGAMSLPVVGGGITKIVKAIGLDTFLGIGKVEEKKVDKTEDEAEKKKLERQQKEAEDTKRVKEQERKAQYKGEDEIVRKRHGIEEKTTTMRAEERKEAEAAKKEAPAAPPTKPTPAPAAAAPAAAAKKAEPEVKVPTPSGDDKWIMDMIKKHEGVRTKPYKDTKGLWTIGVGHLIGDGKSLPPEWNKEFTMAEIDALFAKDYEHHKKQAEKAPGYDKANEKGQAALIDLAFNMGGAWYAKFKNAAAALAAGDFQKAADELVDSQWYKQVKGRAATVVAMIRDGLAGKGGKPTQVAAAPETKPLAEAVPTPSGSKDTTAGTGGSLTSVAKTASGVDVSGIKSEFEKRLVAAANAFKEATGKSFLITSGIRSNEKQKELWDKKVAELGGNEAAARKWVAEPMPPLGKGKGSFHLTGMAVDINSKGPDGINTLAGPASSPTGWLEKFGLTRPVKNEDWHVQPMGLSPTPDNPTNPGAPTLVADKSGKPVDAGTGEKETIGSAKQSGTGSQIASASTDVAAGQREQQKPGTPTIINAQTVNNQTVKTTQTVAEAPKDNSRTIMARAA